MAEAKKPVPKKGIRLEKSAAENPITSKARKGNKNKKRQISALRAMAFIPFAQTNALKMKKKAKEKVVGAVAKKAA